MTDSYFWNLHLRLKVYKQFVYIHSESVCDNIICTHIYKHAMVMCYAVDDASLAGHAMQTCVAGAVQFGAV